MMQVAKNMTQALVTTWRLKDVSILDMHFQATIQRECIHLLIEKSQQTVMHMLPRLFEMSDSICLFTHNDICKENTSKLDAGPQVKIDLNLNIYKGAYL